MGFLQVVQQIYIYPVKNVLERVLPQSEHRRLVEQTEAIRALFTYSIPLDLLRKHLRAYFEQQVRSVFASDDEEEADGINMQQPLAELRREALQKTRSLHNVGLGGLIAQRVFADVMCDALSAHVKTSCAERWSSPSTVAQELQEWIENEFARFVVETLVILEDWKGSPGDSASVLPHSELVRWKEMGLRQLGLLRTDELFDIVVDWDETKGAIEDLRAYTTTPEARSHLSNTFSTAIGHRLLQPGASTIQILQVYVAIIRAFTVLDPKGVLLDRVARPIRRYLRERDDTVNIVVGGLLADPDAEEGEESLDAASALIELAREMNDNPGLSGSGDASEDNLDFDDMNWVPDPVDAGPDYKKSRNSDVIGSLISLFESKTIFVQEFQRILSERLLQQEYDFDREIRVLELLKMRFGETALQACEVMLRDILDSRRVDAYIRQKEAHLLTPKHPLRPSVPDLHTRILSHLFWPPMPTEEFSVPPEIGALQSVYSSAFEEIKASRKLTWLNTVGQVTVTLDLDDRTITETVSTWQAAVIYTFQPSPLEEKASSPRKRRKEPISRSVDELSSKLSMNASLVLNACLFWTGRNVLHRLSDFTFSVLETLPPSVSAIPTDLTTSPTALANISATTATRATTTSATSLAPNPTLLPPTGIGSSVLTPLRSSTTTTALPTTMAPGVSNANAKILPFAPYITGMLTNASSPMTLPQILMMLRVAVPGGFPHGEPDLRAWLEEEVTEGRVEVARGGGFRVRMGSGTG